MVGGNKKVLKNKWEFSGLHFWCWPKMTFFKLKKNLSKIGFTPGSG